MPCLLLCFVLMSHTLCSFFAEQTTITLTVTYTCIDFWMHCDVYSNWHRVGGTCQEKSRCTRCWIGRLSCRIVRLGKVSHFAFRLRSSPFPFHYHFHFDSESNFGDVLFRQGYVEDCTVWMAGCYLYDRAHELTEMDNEKISGMTFIPACFGWTFVEDQRMDRPVLLSSSWSILWVYMPAPPLLCPSHFTFHIIH